MKKHKLEVTNGDLLQAYDALVEIGGIKFPPGAGLRIARIWHVLETEQRLIRGQQDKITREHCVYDDKGNPVHPQLVTGSPDVSRIVIRPERQEQFRVELEKLLAGTVSIEVPLLRLEDFEFEIDGKPVRFAPDTFRSLGALLVEVEPADVPASV